MVGEAMRITKKERHRLLKETIENNPFVTDEELAEQFQMSIQTIRLDRMELSIPELRERIKHVASQQFEEVKSLKIEEIIGEMVDLQLDKSAISIFDVRKEHVFSRNSIARGHYLFAQANSLAVAVLNDELALTTKANVEFLHQVKENERVVAKAEVLQNENERGRAIVEVNSFVNNELVFTGNFELYRTSVVHSEEGKES